MRKVDKLGRIVIPLELRKKYGLNEGTSVDFVDEGEGVIVKSSTLFCKICKSKIDEKSELPLCENCITRVVREYKEK